MVWLVIIAFIVLWLYIDWYSESVNRSANQEDQREWPD